LVVLVAIAGGSLARADVVRHESRRLAPAKQVVLRRPFQRITGITGILAGGDYTLFSSKQGSVNTGWVVTDTRLGSRTALPPQCHIDALGPPWLVIGCPTASDPGGPVDVELYSLVDGTERTITPSAGIPECQSPADYYAEVECADEPDGVGADWISWDATCYNCGDTFFFQNLQTGVVRKDPTNATTFVDLNAPALARRTCPGVRLIRDFSEPGVSWNSLTPYGQWALVTGHANGAFLERCGRPRPRLVLGHPFLASNSNPGAIVWQAHGSALSGLFLPSLQRFTVVLPSAIAKHGTALALVSSSGGIYVQDGSFYGRFWRTASPAALPRNTRQPSATLSGSTLTCRRGSWRNADRFSYAWRVNGITRKGDDRTLAAGQFGLPLSATCSVTASNADGTTTASSAQLSVG
jgi:hypothetical protein